MKTAIIAALFIATALTTSCSDKTEYPKPAPVESGPDQSPKFCFECTIVYTAYGRGTVSPYKYCDKTDASMQLMIDSVNATSNDTIQRMMVCNKYIRH